jgi:competence ComEA-like helix-hairpin-helix protein
MSKERREEVKKKITQLLLVILIIIVFTLSLLLTINNLTKPSVNQSVNVNLMSNNQRINLNKATKDDLIALPNIGEVIAQRIIDYRKNKQFDSIEELNNIKGIGTETIKILKNEVYVD